MLSKIKSIIKKIFGCRHPNALLYSNSGYCPDCGKYLKKTYYILRCVSCDIKRNAKKDFEKIIPIEKFCANCGEEEYKIEKYDKLNFVDINYAIETKETVEDKEKYSEFEIWVDKPSFDKNENSQDTKEVFLLPEFKYLNYRK